MSYLIIFFNISWFTFDIFQKNNKLKMIIDIMNDLRMDELFNLVYAKARYTF